MFKKKQDTERKPVEQEIAELQRKFRVLENDKRAYSEDSQAIIRKQRATIEKLTRENRQMKQDMNETRAVAGSRSESKSSAIKLQEISVAKDDIERELKEYTDQRNHVSGELEQLRKDTWGVREELCKQGGADAAKIQSDAVAKQIRVLENRLDKSLQKFNEAIAHNKRLREDIDGLRRERVVFDSIYKKLEAELRQKKQEMANIIEQANAAYEARDQAQAQMGALKAQADKEHREFEHEWKELGRLIENDKKMKEFMKQKERHVLQDQDGPGEEDAGMKKKLAKGAYGAKDKANFQQNNDKVSQYEEAFQKMQAATGIADIDDLVEQFISAEDQNFSLFEYANELSGEIEKHEEEIAKLKKEYDALKGTGGGSVTVEKQKLFGELEERMTRFEKTAEHYELQTTKAGNTIKAVRSGIIAIYKRLHESCKTWGAHEDPAQMSDSTMVSFLGLVEERAAEIYIMYCAQQEDGGAEMEEPQAAPKLAGGGQLQIRLPSTVEDYSDDEEEDDEDDQRPFTREELKLKTMRGIQKKQEKSKKGGGRRGN